MGWVAGWPLSPVVGVQVVIVIRDAGSDRYCARLCVHNPCRERWTQRLADLVGAQDVHPEFLVAQTEVWRGGERAKDLSLFGPAQCWMECRIFYQLS